MSHEIGLFSVVTSESLASPFKKECNKSYACLHRSVKVVVRHTAITISLLFYYFRGKKNVTWTHYSNTMKWKLFVRIIWKIFISSFLGQSHIYYFPIREFSILSSRFQLPYFASGRGEARWAVRPSAGSRWAPKRNKMRGEKNKKWEKRKKKGKNIEKHGGRENEV